MQADIAVLTVIPEELRWAREALGIKEEPDRKVHGTNYWHGSVRSSTSATRSYSVVLTCIARAGNPRCAVATSEVISEYSPQFVFLMGIAAGIRDKVKVGEVVLSERVVAYEPAAIETMWKVLKKIVPRPDMPRIEHTVEQDVAKYLASSEREARINNKFQSLKGNYPVPPKGKEKDYAKHVAMEVKVKNATIASGEKLLRHPGKLHWWRENVHGRIEVAEMEAAGLAEACRPDKVPWLVIRGISDFGDRFKDDRFHEFAAKMAAAAMSDFLAYGIDLGPSSSSLPKAYYKKLSGHMLERESLDQRDFEEGNTVKPRQVDAILETLKCGKSVAVQGPPGSGKSALAAWVNWEGEKAGLLFAYYGGRELQEGDPSAQADRLQAVPANYILIIDDIHLAQKVLPRLKPLFGCRRFFLLGRTGYVEEARKGGLLPTENEKPIDITDEDSQYVAEKLARKYVTDEAKATRLLDNTGKDLVYTKWLLEGVVVRHADPKSTPEDAAIKKLEALGDELGHEPLRLFLTLAAFGWVELWCPETFLVPTLGFDLNMLQKLYKETREGERQAQGGGVHRLLRHPKLCELFLKVAPNLGAASFDKKIFAPTCAAMIIKSDIMKSHDFASLILGAWGAGKPADLDSIAWRLIYAGRGSDYMNIVKAA